MIVLGVCGGVASGKSVVAGQLQALGAQVLDVDRVGHEVLADPKVIRAAVERFGTEVLDGSGQLCRRQIARRVFAPTPAGRGDLEYWESWTHPRIGALLERRLGELREREPLGVVVVDAAVLFKAGWDRFCDKVIYVDAPRSTRLRRALARGWSPEDFSARETVQLPLEEKRRRSHIVIDNSGSLDQTYDQVLDTWNSLSR
jgi:dephospho-CoA kinase